MAKYPVEVFDNIWMGGYPLFVSCARSRRRTSSDATHIFLPILNKAPPLIVGWWWACTSKCCTAPAMAPEEVQLCKCLIKKKMYSIKFHRVPLSPQTLRNKAAIKECLCTLKHKGKSSWCYWVSVNLLRNKWNWVGLYCNWTVREGWSLTSGLTGSWKGALRTLLRIRRVSRSHFYKQANKRERH